MLFVYDIIGNSNNLQAELKSFMTDYAWSL